MNNTYLYQINVTRDCNLRCTHCYIHSDVKKASGKMKPEHFQRIFAGIADHMESIGYEHAEIHVIGGEPTILGAPFFDANMPAVREIMAGRAFKSEIMIVSNLLTPESIEIARHFDRVNTSYEPETRFPKPKLEQRWRDNVLALQERGVDINVTTAVTTKTIEMGAATLLDRFYAQGIKQIHFGFFIPSGDGLVNSQELFPEFVATSNFMIDAARWYFERRDSDPDLYVNPPESMLASIGRGEALDDIVCPIIAGSMDIDWDGKTATCLEEGGNKDADWHGNVLTEGVREVAAKRDYRKRVIEAARPGKPCRTCDEYEVCRSGCGVIYKYWDPEVDEDCPGFKKFIKFMRGAYESGMRARYEDYSGKVAF